MLHNSISLKSYETAAQCLITFGDAAGMGLSFRKLRQSQAATLFAITWQSRFWGDSISRIGRVNKISAEKYDFRVCSGLFLLGVLLVILWGGASGRKALASRGSTAIR